MRVRPPLSELFWSKVARRGPDECWLWTAKSRTRNGYGVAWADLGDGHRTHTAHRVAFFLSNGRPPSSTLDVMHSCDVRLCCNPAHLSEGTRADNMHDCAAKRRTSRRPRVWGDDHPRSKLNVDAVIDIRRRVAAGEMQKDLAVEYGVKKHAIGHVVHRRFWAHVP